MAGRRASVEGLRSRKGSQSRMRVPRASKARLQRGFDMDLGLTSLVGNTSGFLCGLLGDCSVGRLRGGMD